MNRIVAFGAAMMLASTNAVMAGQKAVTIGFDGTCDGLTLTLNKDVSLYGSNHVATCPGTPHNPIPGIGIVVKHGPSFPDKAIAVSDSNLDPQGVFVTYFIQLPLATGNGWTAFATTDGEIVTEVSAGTYTVK